jgi:hypothetical protein
MDFDIGNILYIVITLVAVIIGLLGKKKKPADQGEGGEGGEAQPGFMENLERVLRMGQENPEVTDLQAFEEDVPAEAYVESESEPVAKGEPRQAPSIMDDYERIMHNRQEEDLDIYFKGEGDENEALEVIELDEKSGTGFLDLVQEFDARTAIVYSAIINRLDY